MRTSEKFLLGLRYITGALAGIALCLRVFHIQVPSPVDGFINQHVSQTYLMLFFIVEASYWSYKYKTLAKESKKL